MNDIDNDIDIAMRERMFREFYEYNFGSSPVSIWKNPWTTWALLFNELETSDHLTCSPVEIYIFLLSTTLPKIWPFFIGWCTDGQYHSRVTSWGIILIILIIPFTDRDKLESIVLQTLLMSGDFLANTLFCISVTPSLS